MVTNTRIAQAVPVDKAAVVLKDHSVVGAPNPNKETEVLTVKAAAVHKAVIHKPEIGVNKATVTNTPVLVDKAAVDPKDHNAVVILSREILTKAAAVNIKAAKAIAVSTNLTIGKMKAVISKVITAAKIKVVDNAAVVQTNRMIGIKAAAKEITATKTKAVIVVKAIVVPVNPMIGKMKAVISNTKEIITKINPAKVKVTKIGAINPAKTGMRAKKIGQMMMINFKVLMVHNIKEIKIGKKVPNIDKQLA